MLQSPLAEHWTLDPEVVFLNHGSFGATPKRVLDHQAELRAELERQPVRFMARRLPSRLDEARVRLAAFLGAEPADLAAVTNATSGVNAVLRSLDFGPGDELVTTSHEYNACRNALDYVALRSGARTIVAPVPFPIDDPARVVEAIEAACTSKTRLVLVDHVTSPTGLVMPIAAIADRLATRGIDLLVDGAHAPGMLDLNLTELGVAYYTGNCHKWICAPKGAAFLFVREDRRHVVRPPVISHGYNMHRDGRSRFHDEFDWVGTADPTAFLTVPTAIDTMASLVSGGWAEIRRRNRELAFEARAVLTESLGIEPPAPDAMIGSLVALALPDGDGATGPTSPLYTDPLQDALLEQFQIEVPIVPWPSPPKRLVRVSSQLYNTRSQYQRLAHALHELL